jgi:NitT/TauT family transport system permease protein
MSAGLLSIYAKPGRTWSLLLSWALFATGIGAYLFASHARHLDNPEDRVMPTVTQMARGMYDAALRPAEEDEAQATDGTLPQRFLNSMLWKDTKATSRRFLLSMVLLVPAVILGLQMGLFR